MEGMWKPSLIARFMGPIWGPSGADRTQVGPMLAPWTLLSGMIFPLSDILKSNSKANYLQLLTLIWLLCWIWISMSSSSSKTNSSSNIDNLLNSKSSNSRGSTPPTPGKSLVIWSIFTLNWYMPLCSLEWESSLTFIHFTLSFIDSCPVDLFGDISPFALYDF